MKTNISTRIAATLSFVAFAAATSSNLHAQENQMNANVPVEFVAGKTVAPAGAYQVRIHRAGIVAIRDARGKNLALANLPVQTTNQTQRASLRFERKDGAYQLSGYCMPNLGCWAAGHKDGGGDPFEVALGASR